MTRTSLYALILTLAPSAFAAFPEKHFKTGWTAVGPQEAPKAPLLPGSRLVGRQQPGDVEGQHAGAAHVFITRKAFELYDRRFPGSELARFIGPAALAGTDDNVTEGSWDEDSPYENPFNEAVSVLRHFWSWRTGPMAGLWGNDSGVNRAHKYWTGGYGIDGIYDKNWGKKGAKDMGVLGLYRKGEKAKAYWYLGHAAHLLQDLTIPAHNLLWAHPAKNVDRYETWMGDHHGEWSALPAWPEESPADLYSLYLETARAAERYDAGNNGGSNGVDGSVDQGKRREGGFTDAELREEAAVLMPLAVTRVALLFRHFFKQTDVQAPAVRLKALADGSGLEIETDADVSGIDAQGYFFEIQALGDKGWGDWTAVEGRELRPQAGLAYRVIGRARDGAGNVGSSDPAGWPSK